MKQTDGSVGAKRRAGEAAAATVEDDMVVGLGTGSTTAHAIRALGDAVDDGLSITGVPTSFQSRRLAREVGIPVVELGDVTRVDVAIDGADQVASGAIVKGGGAAHAREKLVATAADRFLVVIDETKLAGVLSVPVPVEVLPDAYSLVSVAIEALGGTATLRDALRKDGPVVTENGNLVLDCAFGEIETPEELATALSGTPGVVEHGLFVALADAVYVGTDDGVTVRDG